MSDESTAPVLPPPTRLKERLLPWFWYATLIGIVGVLVWIVRDHQWHVVWRSLPFLLEGLGVSWALTLISVGIGMVVGTVLAAARMRGPAGVRHAAVFVIEVVRAIPQLMVIFWVFFTCPAITGGQSLSAWTAAVVSLSAIASAYLADFAPYALYTTMAVGYLVCCWALSWLVRRLDPKYTLMY